MISISSTQPTISGVIPLPASKSESNRALIIQALNSDIRLDNLSSARDTQTMIRLLKSEGHVLDVIDAGTTMRFLTAYCCVSGRDQILTGTPRMCNRPIGALVSALQELGATIKYWNQEGYPPLHVRTRKSDMKGGSLSMPGNVSSQFISAILLVSPYLEGGLNLSLTEGVTSRPYLNMTMDLMRHFGARAEWLDETTIQVEETGYHAASYSIESDWSGASYWFSFVALSKGGQLLLKGLRENSLQGDRAIVEMMEPFGVKTTFTEEGAILEKTNKPLPASLEFDCIETPDLAQTLAVTAGAAGVSLKLTGLHTLRVKETDRIDALVAELSRFGLQVEGGEDWLTVNGEFSPSNDILHTYEDHRMAMAFAPLVLKQSRLTFDDEEVVVKSYPEFWDHLKLIGIQ